MTQAEKNTFDQKVATTKLRLLANQNTVTVFASNIGVPIVVFSILYTCCTTNIQLLIGWLAIGGVLATLRLIHHQYLDNFEKSERPISRWVLELGIFSTLSGLFWSSSGILFLNPENTSQSIVLIAAKLGVMAGAVPALASHSRIFFAFILSTWIPAGVYYLYVGSPFFLSIGVIGTLFFGIIIFFSLSQRRTVEDSLGLSHENVELLEELRQQKRKAEDANQAKSRFLAVASHDLRQPIHAIRLFSESLMLKANDKETKSMTLMLSHSIDTLSELFGSLLDMSKLEAHAVEPEISRVQVDYLVSVLSTEFSMQCQEKQLELHYNAQPGLIIDSDPVLLERVLRNLIWNAIKYTTEGRIFLAARKRGNNVRIEIWDTGCGIPDEELPNIFQEFHQGLQPNHEARAGIGLGLSIVKGLCDLLGYRIHLKSKVGHGSVFFVEIPLSKDQSPLKSILPDFPSRNAYTQDTNLTDVKVLVVDDDADICSAMNHVLQQWGCEVRTAESAETVMSIIEDFTPDIILSDYQLRGSVTGDILLRRVNEVIGYELPNIIITGDTSVKSLFTNKNENHRLLHKPVDTTVLEKTMIQALNG